MKKIITTCFILLWLSHLTFAQNPLAGIKTIPGDFPTVADAIFALNTYGISGAVTFNVAAGHSETFPSNVAGMITTTGTAEFPIVFQKSGAGDNPVIISGIGSGQYDGIIGFKGVSYITFDAIDLRDINSTTTTAMEWGYGLFRLNGTTGSQHITIKNCNIIFNNVTMSNIAQGYGILSRSTDGTSGTTITVTALSGTNSYNGFYNNSFSKCNGGIYLEGYSDAAPYQYYDQDNNVGGDESGSKSGELGNSISEWHYHGIYGARQNNITIAGNVLSGVASGGQVYGIYLNNMPNSSFNVHDNTISADFTTTGTGSFWLMYCETTSGTSNTTNFYNNSVINSTVHGVSATGNITTMFVKGGCTTNVYGNTISGNTYGDNSNPSYSTIYFLNVSVDQVTPGICNIYNNTVTNNLRKVIFPPTDTQAYTWLLSLSGNNGSMSCHDNLFDQNSSKVQSQAQLVTINTTGTLVKFYNNQISNYESRGFIYGMNLMGSSDKQIYNNKISNITTLGGDKYIYGILSQGTAASKHYCYNNYISELNAPNAKGTRILGIYASTGQIGLYNNTIYLNAANDTVTASFGTAGIYGGADPSLKLDLRNNIVVNNSPHLGTGVTAALRFSATAPPFTSGNYAATSNNNDFYAGSSAPGNYIFYQSTTVRDSTLADFKLRVWPRESASVSELAPFVNILSPPVDLHLKTDVSSQCESGATVVDAPISVTSDYDGQARFPNAGYPDNALTPASAPDIGADEFGGLKVDITPPTITLTPLANTISTEERILTTTITDGSGVPNTGNGLPMLYWKKFAAGTWNSVQSVWASASTYNFTFGNGVAVNDSVYYYIVAQDLVTPLPNIGSSPVAGTAGFTANPPACAVPPVNAVLFAYKVVAPACGVYNVGAGQSYATLTAAFTDLAGRPVTCPVTLLLTDATYPTQTYPILIPQLNGISLTNTLTIKPAPGVTPIFSGSSATGIFNFNGAKYIIIDGSNGTAGDKSLTWVNTSTAAESYTIGFVNAGTGKSTDCVLKNCVIKASSQVTNNTYGVFMSPAVGGYNNIVIDNNTICSARIGIKMAGSTTEPALNVQITNNIIGNAVDAQAIQFQGILVGDASNTLIRGNEIMGAYAGNANTSMDGIYLSTGAASTKIRQNMIHHFSTPAASGNSVDAINLFTGSAATQTEITNNLIYGIKGKNGCMGINIAYGGNVLIAFNTVSLTDTTFYDAASASRYSACLRVASGVTLLDVRNNVFKNTQQCIEPLNTSPLTYAVYSSSAASAYTFINYNDYFVNEPYSETGLSGRIGYLSGQKITLANWQAATLQDANSQNVNPMFVSPTNLHTAVPALNNAGIAIPAVTTDLASVARTNPPDLGAYEFTVAIGSINTLAASAIGLSGATLGGDINTSGEVAGVGFEYGTSLSYGNYTNAAPSPVRSFAGAAFNATLAGLAEGTLYHYRAKGVSTTSAETIYGADMTFTTLGVPANTTIQNEIIVNGLDTCYNATQTITIAGSGNTFAVANGGSAIMVAGQNIIYLPGTTVADGGYMHGYITTTSQYCSAIMAPIAATISGMKDSPVTSSATMFNIYPNPTTGAFTLELTSETEQGTVNVGIFGMRGDMVLNTNLSGQKKAELSLAGKPAGIYFVRVISGGRTETSKIIKQ